MRKLFKMVLLLSLVAIVFAIPAMAVKIVASGECGDKGDNVTWTLDEEGILTISGNGDMNTFVFAPWFSYRFNIQKVVINDGVTNIGNDAFDSCRNLSDVTIPDSVKTIGNSAFSLCKNLSEITIPDSVITIGDYAFYDCDSLSEITIPNSVTTIGDYAFLRCDSLTQITLSNSMTTIGNGVFSQCYSLSEIKIPDSVISIGDSVFSWCDSLSEITIPSGVTTIGNDVFSNCINLSKITIPDSVISIGDSAFLYCLSLSEITIPDNVISIGDGAFAHCEILSEIKIPSSVRVIGDSAFYYCTNLSEITIPNSVTTIKDWAFDYCSAMKNAIFQGDVPTEWGYDVFDETASDFTIYYCNGTTGWTSPTWTAPDGTVYNTIMLSREEPSDIEVFTTHSDITYTVQNQSLTVSNNNACVVTYQTSDGQYTALNTDGNTDGGYVYTVPTDVTAVTISVKGDYDSNGTVEVSDALNLQKAILGKTHAVETDTPDVVCDINGDGRITAIDLALIAAAALDKYQLTW